MRLDIKVKRNALERTGKTRLIKGEVRRKGLPTSCIVRAYNRENGELLSQTQSRTDGSYILFGSNFGSSYVIAIDPEQEFNLGRHDLV
ncbi:hypothetical protein ACNPQK_08490 [Acinetobacter guillouiae]|uniref:hypothetical protein n=1 Tax=Acinetobacter guillouiae TaxID=106649 RepID=UPI003AF56C57